MSAWLSGSDGINFLKKLLIAFSMALPIYIFINSVNFSFSSHPHRHFMLLEYLFIYFLLHPYVHFYFMVLGVRSRALHVMRTNYTIELCSIYLNFNDIHPKRCYVKSHYSLIYISLMISDVHNFRTQI